MGLMEGIGKRQGKIVVVNKVQRKGRKPVLLLTRITHLQRGKVKEIKAALGIRAA